MQIDRPLLVIPSLAIHMQSAEKTPLNPQVDLLPLFGQADQSSDIFDFLAEELQISKEEILDADLFLYPLTSGCIWGKNNEFLSAPRLDDLQCVFGALQGFLEESHPQSLPVYCVFDNEEVGSSTKQGAKSTFLFDVLSRICHSLGINQSQMLASSMMLSCDNAHAIHPNHPEKADPKLCPRMNGGVVIKYNANQKYTTDGVSGALFRKICKEKNIPIQVYANRSDVPGGSTLGNLSCEKVSVNTIDIGLAQLAMHSAWETAGAEDTLHLADAIRAFYQTAITVTPNSSYVLDFV
jgi:aspartyl aminopeptidase